MPFQGLLAEGEGKDVACELNVDGAVLRPANVPVRLLQCFVISVLVDTKDGVVILPHAGFKRMES